MIASRRAASKLATVVALAFCVLVADALDSLEVQAQSGPPTRNSVAIEKESAALEKVASWEERLKRFETQIADGTLETEEELRLALGSLRSAVSTISEAEPQIERDLAAVNEQLRALGTGPKTEGETEEGTEQTLPEDQELKQTLQRLQQRGDRLQGALKRISLLKTRIEQIQSEILAELRARAQSRYLTKYPSPILPKTLLAAVEEGGKLGSVLTKSVLRAIQNFAAWQIWTLAGGLAALFLAVLMARTNLLSQMLLNRIAPRHAGPETCHSLTAQILLRAVAPGAIAYGVGQLFTTELFALGEAHELALAVSDALWRYLTAFGLLHIILQTGHRGKGNLIGMRPAEACRLTHGVNLLIVGEHVIYATYLFNQSTRIPDNLASVAGGSIAVALAVMLGYIAHIGLPHPMLEEEEEEQAADTECASTGEDPAAGAEEEDSEQEAASEEIGAVQRAGLLGAQIVRLTLFLLVLATVVVVAMGYTVMALQTLVSLLAIGVFIGFLSVVHAFVVRLFRHFAGTRTAQDLRRHVAMPRNFRSAAAGWLHTLFVLALIVVGILGSLMLAGVPREIVREDLVRLFTGVRIGEIEISLTAILIGVGVFLLIVVLTRWVQTLVASRLFRKSQLDVGIQNSISTFIGYAGFALAAILAIGSFGLDLSNLAVIAGALSVGIGFGLQAIVNNFVSGIILLIERPIKIGDWIELNGQHGIVKRINVRSTEIETFQRQTIIVPNSELISRSVTNYTHKDKRGRIEIKVGVAHGTDIDKLQEILLAVARKSRHLLRHPAPYVFFGSIGDNALHLELRVYLRDINWYLDAMTELNSEVYKALRENGIEIAYPQRTLHIPQLAEIWDGGRPPGKLPEPKSKGSPGSNEAPTPISACDASDVGPD